MFLVLATLSVGLAVTCQPGYYYSSPNCYPCLSMCSTCKDIATCSSCKSGYYLTSYTCVRSQDSSSTPVEAIVWPIVGCVLLIGLIITVCIVKRRNRLRKRALSASRHNHHHEHDIVIVNTTQAIQPFSQPIQYNLNKGFGEPYPATAGSIFPNQGTGNSNVPYVQRPQINAYNFTSIVLPAQLDARQEYFGQGVCLMCSNKLSFEIETRVLPCGHAFHGKCAYDHIAVGSQKYCPVCKTLY